MKDETYAFISDVKDKKITARSARHTRTHCGKGGRVRLPHDNLSKKELQKMNGECKSFRLNDPMAWKEFKSMPDDLKITYIKLLRQKYKVPNKNIAEMLGVHPVSFSKEVTRLGISEGKNCRGRCTKWDKEGFYAWWHGVDTLPTPVMDERTVIDPITMVEKLEAKIKMMESEFACGMEKAEQKYREEPIREEEPEAYVEDDLPFEEPDPRTDEFTPSLGIPVAATPINGSMQFNCPADQALNMLGMVLGKTNCAISVMWRVIEDGGAEDGKA